MPHHPDYAYAIALRNHADYPEHSGQKLRVVFPDDWRIVAPCVSVTPYGPTDIIAEGKLRVQRSSMQVDTWHIDALSARQTSQQLERITDFLTKQDTPHGKITQGVVTSRTRPLSADDDVTKDATPIHRCMFLCEVVTIGEPD